MARTVFKINIPLRDVVLAGLAVGLLVATSLISELEAAIRRGKWGGVMNNPVTKVVAEEAGIVGRDSKAFMSKVENIIAILSEVRTCLDRAKRILENVNNDSSEWAKKHAITKVSDIIITTKGHVETLEKEPYNLDMSELHAKILEMRKQVKEIRQL